MIHMGFIGYMEICFIRNPKQIQFLFQGRQKLMEKFSVFPAGSIRFPAEDPLADSVFVCHDLWGGFCAPLAEQM